MAETGKTTVTITTGTSTAATLAAVCQVCGGYIPLYQPTQSVFPVCMECCKRMKKILYPER